jgi:hypothetical protein
LFKWILHYGIKKYVPAKFSWDYYISAFQTPSNKPIKIRSRLAKNGNQINTVRWARLLKLLKKESIINNGKHRFFVHGGS